MVDSIDIKNFRCYSRLTIDDVGALNVVVGENGIGKTTLLEAIFLALGSTTDIANRYRLHRGQDSTATGTSANIWRAFFREFFHRGDFNKEIEITLTGQGEDQRSVLIRRAAGPTIIPGAMASPFTFKWTDRRGAQREVPVGASAGGWIFPETGEELPNFFYYPANVPTNALENATRFSELAQTKNVEAFTARVRRQFPHVKEMRIEVAAGSVGLYAELDDGMLVPLANFSGGATRMVAIQLAVWSAENSIVVVDEIENGIYFRHLPAMWTELLAAVREKKRQMFVSTHSRECLEALASVAGDAGDVRVWRFERNLDTGEPRMVRIKGRHIADALTAGDIR